jgi:hypothetical protein
LRDPDVNLESLKKHVSRQDVVDALGRIGATGPEYATSETSSSIAALSESSMTLFPTRICRSSNRMRLRRDGGPHTGEGPTWELKTVHEQTISTVRTKTRTGAHDLIDLTLELFDLLEPEFDARWAARRHRASSVRDW